MKLEFHIFIIETMNRCEYKKFFFVFVIILFLVCSLFRFCYQFFFRVSSLLHFVVRKRLDFGTIRSAKRCVLKTVSQSSSPSPKSLRNSWLHFFVLWSCLVDSYYQSSSQPTQTRPEPEENWNIKISFVYAFSATSLQIQSISFKLFDFDYIEESQCLEYIERCRTIDSLCRFFGWDAKDAMNISKQINFSYIKHLQFQMFTILKYCISSIKWYLVPWLHLPHSTHPYSLLSMSMLVCVCVRVCRQRIGKSKRVCDTTPR